MNTQYFTGLINDLSQRTTSGVMSWLNVSNLPLRQHLFELFNRPYGDDGSFIASPTFEPVYGWRPCKQTMEELSNSLLSKKLVDALDKPFVSEEKLEEAKRTKSDIEDYRFPKEIKPYLHQLESWQVLNDKQPKSLVVTSGTGSGKTECFMIPILDSLARDFEKQKAPLEGVQALFLYPLNALINSQKDRLLAWTGNFERNIRFCLFNGNTPEQPERGGNKNLSEVADRKTLRASPPPILVTNATMLEYMLVRNDDRPIIEKSKGKLKWIVLDEAHSYVGSQAAELSLLIRRVIHAFNVEPSEVRFIATSATIGDPEGEAGQSLRQFLADVGGIDISQVELRYGVREVAAIAEPQNNHPKSINELESCEDQEALYKELLRHPFAYKIRKLFAPIEKRGSSSPTQALDIGHVCVQLFGKKEQFSLEEQTQALRWLDVLASAKDANGLAYLPLRAHIYHQTMTGLWACADPNCSEKHLHSPKLNQKGWHYGEVYLSPRNHCLCGAPVYELIFCDDCGEVYLNAQENSIELSPYDDRQNIDEFELEREGDDEDVGDEEHTGKATRLLITNRRFQDATIATESINKNTRKFCEPNQTDVLTVQITPSSDVLECPSCKATLNGKVNKIKSGRVGTPYLLSDILPTLLEYAPDGKDDPINKPYRGRRLLTFNDSRQGTARIATRLQQDSERAKARSWIYHYVNQSTSIPQDSPDVIKLKDMIKKAPNESIKKFLESELENASSKQVVSVTFSDLQKSLCNQGADFHRIHQIYKNYAPNIFNNAEGAKKVAELLIFRELAYRPKKSNNLETLGLISLTYPHLINIESIPDKWSESGLNIEDWRSFLKICLDFFVRAGRSIEFDSKDWRYWLSIHLSNNWLCSSNEDARNRQKKWPNSKSNRRNVLISLLSIVTKLDPKTEYGRDVIDGFLNKAWDDLIKVKLLQNSEGGYNLQMESVSFITPKEIWVCPYTRRFIDVTLNGYSPYTPIKNNSYEKCFKSEAPIFPANFDISSSKFMKDTRNWILSSEVIGKFRLDGLWSSNADRILENTPFYKTAEHSAQQKSKTLDKYEREFKSGELNILSCSTTMEMGIDIGGIQLVAMNNVPPHPANYLQRAGRAGRRSETKSAAVTVCKANPHDQHVFKNSNWAFSSKFPTPKVSLSSDLIIQRHINSYLLGMFLNSNTDSALKLTSGDFFIGEEGPWKEFVNDLNKYSKNKENFKKAIEQLVKNSPFEHQSYETFMANSAEMINRVRGIWYQEWSALIEEQIRLQASANDPASKALEYRKERHKGEYLLRDLANCGFLPGYGFPTSLVTFNNLKVESKLDSENKQRDDSRRFRAELPTRDIVTALREYAPGSDLVIDGAVYKSAGISLNWHVPASEVQAKNELQLIKFFWKCSKCGASSVTGALPSICSYCQADLEPKDISEYIEPAGFAVDFYEPVTNDISKQKFIKPESPTLSIHGEWSPLKNPNLGRYRSSDHGKVFYQSKGENEKGYALCLGCGRAEPMGANSEYPETLKPHQDHNRLIAKKGERRCSASDQSWMIKKSINFGFETFTDIFEIQLKELNGKWLNDSTVANSLAVAIRNALAEELGIQASELGAAVQEVKTEDGNYVQSIYIYDENNAGYASNIDHLINSLLVKALAQLDCSRGCDSACPSCLLDFEHRHEFDKLNRLSAKKFLTSEWLNSLVIPKEISYFGDSSEVEVKSLAEAIFFVGKRSNVTKIQMCLGDSIDEADFTMSDFRTLAYDLAIVSKKEVNLVIKESALKSYRQDDLVSLRSLVDHDQINALAVKEMPKAKNGYVIAEVIFQNGDCWAWAVSEPAFMMANEVWGKCTPIVRGKSKTSHLDNPRNVDNSEIQLPVVVQGDKEILVKNELDGKLLGFGSRFWHHLSQQHSELNKLLVSDEIVSIEYSDKYIFTPIAIALLKEIVVGLREIVGFDNWKSVNLVVSTIEKRLYTEYKGPQGMIYSDWLNSQERNQVLINVFKEVGVEAIVKSTQQHSRTLTVSFKGNKTLTIRLDKGVSYWRVNTKFIANGESKYFDFGKTEIEQSKQINKFNNLTLNGESIPTEIFIKVR